MGGEGGDGGMKHPNILQGGTALQLLKDSPPNLYKNTLYYKIYLNSDSL